MANRLKGEATFVHDGKELTIAIDAGVLLDVEDETGLGLFQMVGDGLGKLGVLASLLRHGVAQGSEVRWSRAEAAEALLAADSTAGEAVREALTRALPGPKTEGDEDANPLKAAGKRGTGKKS